MATLISVADSRLIQRSWIDLRGGATVEVVRGDLTKFHADVIVNATDEWLGHDGGLAGDIVREGNCSSHKYV